MHKPLLLILLILATLAAFAQGDSVVISGRVMTDSGTAFKPGKEEIRLVPYDENATVLHTTINADGSFYISLGLTGISNYELRYNGYKMSLLLNPAEVEYKIGIKCDAAMEVKTMKIVGSKENDAYRILKRENSAFRTILRDVKAECNTNAKSCLEKYKKQVATHNELMEYLKLSFKGTFTANVLATLSEVKELTDKGTALQQLQNGFFQYGNFNDTALYRTPDFDYKLSMYLDLIGDTTNDARTSFIKNIIEKTQPGSAARKTLFIALFNNFLDELREDYTQSLVSWTQGQKWLATEMPVYNEKIKLISKVLPGSFAPDVTGEGTDGKTQDLRSTVKANKITMLIFWESECPHCRKAMPSFISTYKKYHSQGLEVFAASMDTDKNKWKQFIATNHLAWTNILLPEKSDVHANYFIQYTPTVVLIDNAGKIITRFLAVEDVEGMINKCLAK